MPSKEKRDAIAEHVRRAVRPGFCSRSKLPDHLRKHLHHEPLTRPLPISARAPGCRFLEGLGSGLLTQEKSEHELRTSCEKQSSRSGPSFYASA